MFGNIFSNDANAQNPQTQAQQAPAQPQTPPQATPPATIGSQQAQQSQQSQGQNPGEQQSQQSPGQQSQNPGQQQPAQEMNLLDILQNFGQPAEETFDPTKEAGNLLDAMMRSESQPVDTGAPAINVDRFAEQFKGFDSLQGVDTNALAEALQTGDGAPEALQNALKAVQQNTILSIVPIVNQLVAETYKASTQQAVTASDHNLTASTVVNAYEQRYGPAPNTLMQKMLRSMANAVAQEGIRNVDTGTVVAGLHRAFQGFGGAMTPQTPQQREQSTGRFTTDHSDLFS